MEPGYGKKTNNKHAEVETGMAVGGGFFGSTKG